MNVNIESVGRSLKENGVPAEKAEKIVLELLEADDFDYQVYQWIKRMIARRAIARDRAIRSILPSSYASDPTDAKASVTYANAKVRKAITTAMSRLLAEENVNV